MKNKKKEKLSLLFHWQKVKKESHIKSFSKRL